MPVLKSIATADYYTKNTNQVAIVEKWIPICKTYAAQKTESFAALAAVDGGQALSQFAQTMLQGTDRPEGSPHHPSAGPRSGRQVAGVPTKSGDVMSSIASATAATHADHRITAVAAPRASSAGAPSP